MERGRPLPDLPEILRGQRRRRGGRPPGIIEHLDHLAWLGVDGIWLSPVTASPNADWGYDVADFCAIGPEYGTLEDFDRLVAEARGMASVS